MCDHHHGSGGTCASQVAEVETVDRVDYQLNASIDTDNVRVLNEAEEDTGVTVFKNWQDHLDKSKYVDSDVDEELLFNIPFTGHVKITGITIIGDLNDTHPSRLMLFKNREQMSFEDTKSGKPDQELQLKQDDSAEIDYPLVLNRFADVYHLSIYIPSNFGGETTRVYYIGLRGEFKHNFREKIAIANYESRAIPDDHKNILKDKMHHHIC